MNLFERGMIMDTSLVIMAAGIGSRFGGGIKQLERVGTNGQIIMDYSVHDAIEAGFNKVIFIIRKDIESEFREIIGNKIEKICTVEYAFQEIEDLPNNCYASKNRLKPWGTGQAVLSAKKYIKEPFVVINADDYYGKKAFQLVHEFLVKNYKSKTDYCMVGYMLEKTLSKNGGVSRGIITINKDNYLVDIKETHNIVKTSKGPVVKMGASETIINKDSKVSMNMWGMSCAFLGELENEFSNFLANLDSDDVKSEFILPLVIGNMVKDNLATVKVLETSDTWFGVTYKEDRESVIEEFKQLVKKGVYSNEL